MNFLDAFVAWVGETEAPKDYFVWSALSLLAAACGNRIYLPYRHGYNDVRVTPNLYTMLVGPSGCGKSFAISRVQEVLNKIKEIDGGRRLNAYSGHITHSGMYEAMRTARQIRDRQTGETRTIEMPWAGQFYLIQDELAQALGGMEYAEQIIRALVGMFNGIPFDDRTRTNGHVHLEDYCINWLAGTNLDWLLAAVSPNTLNAGVFRRTVVVVGDHSGVRIPPNRKERPSGWDRLFPSLVARIDTLLDHEGPIALTHAAEQVDARWYMNMETLPRDEHGIATIAGRHDLSLKLALLLAVANNEYSISGDLMAEAQDMTNAAVRWQAEIIPLIQKGVIGTASERLLQFILGRDGWLSHARLAKYAYEKLGLDNRKLNTLLQTWLEAGMIRDEQRNGSMWYREVKE